MTSRLTGVLRCAILALAVSMLFSSPASADSQGTPPLTVTDGAPATVLHGREIPVSLTAANPAGPYGYNLAFSYVLPAGVSYVPGSEATQAGDPRILANEPETGQTTLIWANVDDLSAASSRTISFRLTYDEAMHDVGSVLETEAGAYISTDPRDEADFNADGTPGASGPGSWTGAGTDDAETEVTAIVVEKSEPHPEGEIPRGVHDHQTIYTLTVTNNEVNPTNGVRLEDYLPAGLEFLGCEGTPDHTTDAPTNPGSAEEYPGSGPIEVRPVPDCIEPDVVESVEVDPDGDGPLPDGVYTHVVWNDIGDFGASDVKVLRYAAAIPVRENTMEWSGGDAPAATGAQAVNLDNNSGPETRDEQVLMNGALVTGGYTAPSKPVLEVDDWGTLVRTAEDLAIQKSNDNHGLSQGELTKWTVDVQVSEYRYLNDVVIHDVVPDGLCPLGSANLAHQPSGDDSQCDPVAGRGPSQPYTTVQEQANGTYDITWTKDTYPRLAHLMPNDTLQLTFWTRTRTDYQEDFQASTPILSRDAVRNDIDTYGASFVRCEGGNPYCSTPAPGQKIDSDWTDGDQVIDVSGSGKEAAGPVLEKTVAAQYPASGDCSDLNAAQYGKTVPTYGPGDKVCWRLRVVFPGLLDTHSLDVADFLPNTLDYVDGTWQATPVLNTVPIESFTEEDGGRLVWSIGDDDEVDAGGQVFDVTFKSTVGSPLGHHSGDVEGNLLKFSYENTSGTSFALRDRTDFELKMPELSLLKGVRDVNGTPAGGNGPNSDNKQITGGDTVTYRVDVTNGGDADASSARIWDVLPTGISCADVVSATISNGGTCNAAQRRIEWVGIALDAGQTRTLTYSVEYPPDQSPDQNFVNTAGVVEYTYVTNEGNTYSMVPSNGTVKDPTLTPNTFPAQDVSNVRTPGSSVAKTRTTSITTTGNNTASQATIGERIDYTVTTTIPKNTAIYGIPQVTDALGARQTLVPGSLCSPQCTFDGQPVASAGITVSESPANSILARFSGPYVNDTGHDVQLVLRFSVLVNDVAANVAGSNLGNTATFTYKDQLDRTVNKSGSVNTAIVEPKLAIDKSAAPSPRVAEGGNVTYSIKVTNNGSSPAYDVTVEDAPDPKLFDVVAVNGASSLTKAWSPADRTMRWLLAGPINPGGSVTLTYTAKLVAGSGLSSTSTVDNTAKINEYFGVPKTDYDGSPGRYRRYTGPNDSVKLNVDFPKLSLNKTTGLSGNPDVGNAEIGTPFPWHVVVTNTATQATAYDVDVTDTLPPNWQYVSGSATITPGADFDPSQSGSVASGVSLAWDDVGDLAPGQSLTVDFLAVPLLASRDNPGHGAASPHVNGAVASALDSSGSDHNLDGPYRSNIDTAKAILKVPDLSIDKTPDGGSATAGANADFTIKVKNTGEATAHDVTVDDTLPAGVTYTPGTATASPSAGFSEASADPLKWEIDTIAPGATVTITLPVLLDPSLPDGATLLNNAETRAYDVPTPKEDDGSLIVKTRGDVQITKVDDVDPVVAGTNLTYTLTAKNNGPSDAQNVTITDTLPSPDLAFVSADAPCTNAGNAVTCALGKLTPGETRSVKITAKVDPDQLATIHNTGKVTTTTTDDDPSNNTDGEDTQVITRADVSIFKTADKERFQGGDTVTYTLTAKNDGPSTARNVTVNDAIPGELDFVSVTPGSPTCQQANGTVDCSLGSLQPGASRTITIVAKAKGQPPVPGPGTHEHQLTILKEEAYLSIQAGQTVTRDLTCPNGGIASDGSFRILSVDQGNDFADVHVERADSTGPGSYRFTVRNDTAGQAQVKVFNVCLPASTEATDGHQHSLIAGGLVTQTANGLAQGRHDFHFDNPLGYRQVAPGIVVGSGDAKIVRSEEDGSGGWDVTVEVTSPSADVTVSTRSLKDVTGATADHAHDLVYEHPRITVNVPAGQKVTSRVSCPVGFKGITATFDLPPGLRLLGSEPEPINRDFDLLNTTGQDLTAELDLLCLRITTGTEIDDLVPVINTATIASTTIDQNPGNNSSSAGITISRAKGSADPGPGPVADPPPAPPAPPAASPGVIRVKSAPLVVAGTGANVTVPVACSGDQACAGKVAVSGKVPVGKRAKMTLLGAKPFRVAPGESAQVKVKVKPRFRAPLKAGKVKTLKVKVGGKTVSRKVKVKRSR